VASSFIINYVDPPSFEWIRLPVKPISKISNVWKPLVQSFPLLGNWLVWRIGNGVKARIGEDP
jgi:hypothetical protein